MSKYEDFQTAERRLGILMLLKKATAYTANEIVIRGLLKKQGFAVSTDGLRGDLKHLQECDCVRVEIVGVWLATLTRTGGEVADGLADADGVARPEPGV